MNKIKGQYINNAKGVKTFIGSLDSLPEDLLEDATVLIVETVPVGTVIHSFRTEEPFGYLFCDGQAFDPAKYPELHEVFPDDHVPDLRECGLVCTGLSARPAIANHDTYYVGEFRDDRVAEHKHTATVTDPGHAHIANVSEVEHSHTMSHTHTKGTMDITGSVSINDQTGTQPTGCFEFAGDPGYDGPKDDGSNGRINFRASNTWTGETSEPSNSRTGKTKTNVSVGIADATTGVSVDIANTGTGAVTHGKQVGINYFVKAI